MSRSAAPHLASHQALPSADWIVCVSAAWDEGRAAKLVAMMEAAIQRRFPKGLKVHVCSVDRFGCLAELTRMLHAADLSVTRAKVSILVSLLEFVE